MIKTIQLGLLGAVLCCSTALVGAQTVHITEIRIDHPGGDINEYFELAGDPGLTLSGLTYLVIGDGVGGSGVIEAVVDLSGSSIPGDGYFLAAEDNDTFGAAADLIATLNFENSHNVTHLLVANFTGSDADDLDTNDDGVLDVTPWASILDLIALVEEENPPVGTEYHYGPPSIGPDGAFVPGHVFRIPNVSGPWQIGQFDPIGGSDTPGVSNVAVPPNATGWQSCALHDPLAAEGPPTTWCMAVVEAPPPRVGPPDPRTDTQIEPRFYGSGGTAQAFLEVVIDLDGAATSAVTVDAVCTDASTHGAVVTVSTDGLEVTAKFEPPLPNTECCTMTLGGGAGGSQVIKILQGDVNGSGRVNATDKNLVKGKITSRDPPLAGDDFFYDINMSGRINATDKNLVKGRVTTANELDQSAGCGLP